MHLLFPWNAHGDDGDDGVVVELEVCRGGFGGGHDMVVGVLEGLEVL